MAMRKSFVAFVLLIAGLTSGCSARSTAATPADGGLPPPKQETATFSLEKPPSIPDLARGRMAAPTPASAEETLRESARQWFYGKGVGRSLLSIGTVVLFPPYVIYLLGNAGIQLAGYDPLYMTDALPEGTRKGVLEVYDGVTAVPGRINAAIADEEFYDK